MEYKWFSQLWQARNKSLEGISTAELLDLLKPKCQEIITERELSSALDSKKTLKVKLGADATGELHIGHALPLILLNIFQRAGHDIHFIIGDFTAQIGDPAGSATKRKELTAVEVEQHLKGYKKQISKLIDLRRANVHKNSKWLSKMRLPEFFKVLGALSLGKIFQREDFRERLGNGVGVSMREANYSTLMALDSLHLDIDIEVGAVDQLLNFMHTRDIMGASNKTPEIILMTRLLEGTAGDGRKMSKSFNNYIALSATAADKYGLIMSIPDGLIESYYLGFGDIYTKELAELKQFISKEPLEAKKQLGMLVVAIFHGENKAINARKDFERKFSKKEYRASDEMKVKAELPASVLNVLEDVTDLSRNRIRKLISQGGVKRVEGEQETPIKDSDDSVVDGDVIKVGKLKLFRIHSK
jgi:tyrosyl-tRNA synthetase